MITNDILFNIAAVVGVISIAVIVVAYRSKRVESPTKCGCGKSESGLCDGSHSSDSTAITNNSNNNLAANNSGSIEYSS